MVPLEESSGPSLCGHDFFGMETRNYTVTARHFVWLPNYFQKWLNQPGTAVHTHNLNTQEEEEDQSLRLSWATVGSSLACATKRNPILKV